MAAAATLLYRSIPMNIYEYDVQGIVNGANALTVTDFPPDGQWTPANIEVQSYAIGAVGPQVTPDLTTIVNTNGSVAFTLYSNGTGSARIKIY